MNPRFARLALLISLAATTSWTGCERQRSGAPPAPPVSPAATTAAPATQAATRPVLWPARPETGTFLDRPAEVSADVVRVVSFNVKWNTLFPDVDADRAAKIARIIVALDPDILALQEIGFAPDDRGKTGAKARTAADVVAVLNAVRPPPAGQTWYAYQGSDCVIASKWPLTETRRRLEPPGQRELAAALVDLPDERFACDFYVLNNHYKCCDLEKFDGQRQQQSDAIVAWLRDARTAGGRIELPPRTPIAVVGDLNIVGSFQPVTTLLEGDIQDEAQYGADVPPDWDGSALTDARPLHNMDGPDDWTWRDDTSAFKPGRLDFVLYSDSVLTPVRQFALNTTTLAADVLEKAGLRQFDTCEDEVGKSFDHLPLVVDFELRCGE